MISRTTVVFSRPFDLPGFDEQLPAGDYDIETELSAPPDHCDSARWKASVMVRLHARSPHPWLARNLTVSLADLEGALARDKLTGKDLATFLLDALLADQMVRLVMQADGVSETQIRHLYGTSGDDPPGPVLPSAPSNDERQPPAPHPGGSLPSARSPLILIRAAVRRT